MLSNCEALISVGVDFIGSHLVDSLMNKRWEIVVLDNLSDGSLADIRRWLQSRGFRFVKGDSKSAIWRAKCSSEHAIELAARALLKEIEQERTVGD